MRILLQHINCGNFLVVLTTLLDGLCIKLCFYRIYLPKRNRNALRKSLYLIDRGNNCSCFFVSRSFLSSSGPGGTKTLMGDHTFKQFLKNYKNHVKWWMVRQPI